MKIDETIFRAYDIRGKITKQITKYLAFKIGYQLVYNIIIYQPSCKILVAVDTRESSKAIVTDFMQGIIQARGDVIFLGTVPTPALYYADKMYNPNLSIMITGSHNELSYTGFKILKNGFPFFADELQALKNDILTTDWSVISKGKYSWQKVIFATIYNSYIKDILSKVGSIKSKLRIAIDSLNGTTLHIFHLLKQYSICEFIFVCNDSSRNLENYKPDPTNEDNWYNIQQCIRHNKCDLGFIFDEDGDRIVAFTHEAKPIKGDTLIAIYMHNILMTDANNNIFVVDIKCSSPVVEYIRSLGGKVYISRTGHSFIKANMKRYNACFGGEVSGHIFFADRYFGYDDAIYAALRLCEIKSFYSNNEFSRLINNIPQMPYERTFYIASCDHTKHSKIARLKIYLREKQIFFDELDGIRISNPNNWLLIRASNTEPVIMIMYRAFFAKDYLALDNLVNQLTRDMLS